MSVFQAISTAMEKTSPGKQKHCTVMPRNSTKATARCIVLVCGRYIEEWEENCMTMLNKVLSKWTLDFVEDMLCDPGIYPYLVTVYRTKYGRLCVMWFHVCTHTRLPLTRQHRNPYALCGSKYVPIAGYRLPVQIVTLKRYMVPGMYQFSVSDFWWRWGTLTFKPYTCCKELHTLIGLIDL